MYKVADAPGASIVELIKVEALLRVKTLDENEIPLNYKVAVAKSEFEIVTFLVSKLSISALNTREGEDKTMIGEGGLTAIA